MGLYVAFEGVDGAGLSTQARLLSSWLAGRGRQFINVVEPSGSFIGRLIQGRLAHEWTPSKEALRLLFAADCANEYSSKIRPALDAGKFVVSDRSIFSAMAYGMVDFDKEWLESIYSKARRPDVVFYIKCPPKLAIQRLGTEGMFLKFFERESHLQRVSDNYDLLMQEYPNIYLINGVKSISEIHAEVAKFMQIEMNKTGH